MRSPGNGHSQLISFRLTKHCLIRNTPVFPLRGVALHLVCFLKCTDCFCRVGVTRDFPRGAAASECHLNYLPISRRAARKASLPDGESHRPRLPVIFLAEESKTDCWLWFGKTSLKLKFCKYSCARQEFWNEQFGKTAITCYCWVAFTAFSCILFSSAVILHRAGFGGVSVET